MSQNIFVRQRKWLPTWTPGSKRHRTTRQALQGRSATSPARKEKGMTQVAKDAGLNRKSLYRRLSAEGNPSFATFATVLKVARALGVKLHAEAA